MTEFLLELFSEEIPARFQKQAMEDLRKLFNDGLVSRGLEFKEIKAFVTPRRLGLVVYGLPLESTARQEEKRGPKVGAPDAAINGFLKSAGLTSLAECMQVETPKGNSWIAISKILPQKTELILPAILWDVLQNFPWKKSQNWATGSFRWVRPLRSIVGIFDGKILPYYLYLGNSSKGILPSMSHIDHLSSLEMEERRSCINISDTTQGHRFMSSGEISVTNYADYIAKMSAAKVLIDRDERKEKIKTSAEKILLEDKHNLKEDEALLEEVSGLTEWPVPLIGKIEKEFMEIPPEVLITTMRNNQKYFSVIDDSGVMQPAFVITANLETEDHGAAIIAGNERVLRARFSDAKFFWELDKRTTLESRLPQLSSIVFHAKLGSMAERAKRLETLSERIADFLFKREELSSKREDLKKASLLAKADLVTGMVGEFPELQGVMGSYYARLDGESQDVADAIKEHYSPLGPRDTCPKAPISVVVALADKIDTLIGFFAVNEKPTGSKDPYALRRAALGVLRLIMENELRFNIRNILKAGYATYKQSLQSCTAAFLPEDVVIDELCAFFNDRLKAMLREKGVRHDLVESVFLDGVNDITGQIKKLEIIRQSLLADEGKAMLFIYNRTSNILKIEEKKDKILYSGGTLDVDLLILPEEYKLHEAIVRIQSRVETAISSEDYKRAIGLLASLQDSATSFFEKIIINAETPEVRINRLRMISQLRDMAHQIANFSVLEN